MADLRKKFAAAYVEMHNPKLDSTNPHYKSKFSSLGATIEVIRPACCAHGIAYSQHEVSLQGKQYLVSEISDETETITLSTSLLPDFTDPQKKGIWLTYLKRQQAQSDWFLTGEEDTDGEQAELPQTLMSDDEYRTLQSAVGDLFTKSTLDNTTILNNIQRELGYKLSNSLTKQQYQKAMEVISNAAAS